jgi:microcystin-dependent protein
MGDDLEKGTAYIEGQQVNAANLNAHVDNATIKYTAISSKALKDPAALSDELLINDGGILKKITLQQISSLVTTPPGIISDYAGTTAPAGWLLCYGQTVSRVTYSALFSAIGVTYGAGDGVVTFTLPDCRGRVAAGADNMGGASADRLTTPINGDTLGAAGGSESHVLTEAQLASHQHNGASHTHGMSHTHGYDKFALGQPGFTTAAGSQVMGIVAATTTADSIGNTGGPTATATDFRGSNSAHPNVQPTIIFNKIIKT